MPFSDTIENTLLQVLFGQKQNWELTGDVYLALGSNDAEAEGGNFSELTFPEYSRALVALNPNTYQAECAKDEDSDRYDTNNQDARTIATLVDMVSGFMGTPNGGRISNKKQITFNKTNSAWSIKSFALYNAEKNGTMLFYGTMLASDGGPIVIQPGYIPCFGVGEFSIKLMGEQELRNQIAAEGNTEAT